MIRLLVSSIAFLWLLGCAQGQANNHTIQSGLTSPLNDRIEEWICKCRPDGSFIAHPYLCGSYFLCREKRGLFGKCPWRLWFHPQFLFCTYPSSFCERRVDCDNGVGTNCPFAENTEIDATSPETTSVSQMTIEEWVCLGQPNNSFTAHPYRCGSYFWCREQRGVFGTCPWQLWFHPVGRYCTYPGKFCESCGDCENGWGSNCSGITSTEKPETTITTMATTTTTQSGPPITETICIGRPDGSLVAHPKLCEFYFQCRKQVGSKRRCGSDYWFHPRLLVCRLPGAFCEPHQPCDNDSCETSPDQPIHTTIPTTIPPQCDQTTKTTTSDTTVSDVTTPAVPIDSWICIGQPNDTFMPHPQRCGSFFLCQDEWGMHGVCPELFWFHPHYQICTVPGPYCEPVESCDNGIGPGCENALN